MRRVDGGGGDLLCAIHMYDIAAMLLPGCPRNAHVLFAAIDVSDSQGGRQHELVQLGVTGDFAATEFTGGRVQRCLDLRVRAILPERRTRLAIGRAVDGYWLWVLEWCEGLQRVKRRCCSAGCGAMVATP